MKRLPFMILFALVASSMAQKPNILYIFADDMSYRTVGAYQDTPDWVKTPNMDQLANEGVRFEYAYIGTKCAQARGVGLTGQFQYNVTKSSPYWPTHFKNNGYFTGMIGKWHWGQVRHGDAWNWSRVWEHHLDGSSDYYVDQPIRIDGGAEEVVAYSTDAYADYTVEFIEDRAQDNKPWYLWVCFGAVHGPYTPAARHKGDYAGNKVKIPADIYDNKETKPKYIQDLNLWSEGPNGPTSSKNGDLHDISQQYNEAVSAIDEAVGKIRAALESSGQKENTIVIFTADQGYAWGQHGWTGKKHPHDAALRSPLMVYQPNVMDGNRVVDVPVNGTDIITTFHSLAGIEPANTLDGRDLTGLFTGASESLEEEVMMNMYTGKYDKGDVPDKLENDIAAFSAETNTLAWYMIIKDHHKYIRYLATNYIEEIYNLKEDPEELRNLAAEPKYGALLFDLRATFKETLENKRVDFFDLIPEPQLMYDPSLSISESVQFRKQNISYERGSTSLRVNNPNNEPMEVTVYSFLGAELLQKSSSNSLRLNLSSLHAGTFILSVKINGKESFYGKINNQIKAVSWPS